MQRLKTGTLLQEGKYKIENSLGQGSFGITYLAEHTNLGKKVAIKEFFMKELNSRGRMVALPACLMVVFRKTTVRNFEKKQSTCAILTIPTLCV